MKTIRVTLEYEVPNSATLTEEKGRVHAAARGFISFKHGDPVKLTKIEFVKAKP